MRFYLYQTLIVFFLPIIFFITIQQMIRRQGGWLYLLQRFGIFTKKIERADYWFHCASVGETKLAIPLIREILKTKSCNILISTNTPTSKVLLRPILNENLKHIYLPIDLSVLIKNLIKKIKPKELFVMETELWPALFKHCHKQKIDITILNARLSNKSIKTNAFIKSLLKDCLNSCKAILCQSSLQENHIKLIAPNANVFNAGNLKFHQAVVPKANNILRDLTNREYIAVVSSHHDEEIQLASALISSNNDILLVIIPRHPERCNDLTKKLSEAGYIVSVRSRKDSISESTNIYLADTVGEVTDLIADATICIMGGSFIPHGGQNLLEPASLKKAIICGEHMYNFQDIIEEFIDKKAILVASCNDISEKVNLLLDNEELRKEISLNAYKIFASNKDIVKKYLATMQL